MSGDRFSIIHIGGPISIRESLNVECICRLEEKSIVPSAMNVSEDLLDCLSMTVSKAIEKLTEVIDCICNIWASMSKILKSTNRAAINERIR